jgi:hypothetical protein
MSQKTSRRDLLKRTLIVLGLAALIQPAGGVLGFQNTSPKADGPTAAKPGSTSTTKKTKGNSTTSKTKGKKGKGKGKGKGKSGKKPPTTPKKSG